MASTETTRVTRSHTLHIRAPAADVFPLLCPVREHDWIEGWNGEVFYSESGLVENNCVFASDLPGRGREIWTVSRYEPARYILEFVRMNPDTAVTKLNIALEETADGETHMHWQEVLTVIAPDGAAMLEGLTPEHFRHRMQRLEQILNHYCVTGEMLTAE